MSRKGIKNKPKDPNDRKRVTGPMCARCGHRRKGMKQYRNPFTKKVVYLHDICHKALLARWKYRNDERVTDV